MLHQWYRRVLLHRFLPLAPALAAPVHLQRHHHWLQQNWCCCLTSPPEEVIFLLAEEQLPGASLLQSPHYCFSSPSWLGPWAVWSSGWQPAHGGDWSLLIFGPLQPKLFCDSVILWFFFFYLILTVCALASEFCFKKMNFLCIQLCLPDFPLTPKPQRENVSSFPPDLVFSSAGTDLIVSGLLCCTSKIAQKMLQKTEL